VICSTPNPEHRFSISARETQIHNGVPVGMRSVRESVVRADAKRFHVKRSVFTVTSFDFVCADALPAKNTRARTVRHFPIISSPLRRLSVLCLFNIRRVVARSVVLPMLQVSLVPRGAAGPACSAWAVTHPTYNPPCTLIPQRATLGMDLPFVRFPNVGYLALRALLRNSMLAFEIRGEMNLWLHSVIA
jgi:hypothetical protein